MLSLELFSPSPMLQLEEWLRVNLAAIVNLTNYLLNTPKSSPFF